MNSMDFHVIMAFIYLPVIIVGLIGNTMSFYAYRRPHRKSKVSFLLYWLSISDVFLLLFALPLFSIMYLPICIFSENPLKSQNLPCDIPYETDTFRHIHLGLIKISFILLFLVFFASTGLLKWGSGLRDDDERQYLVAYTAKYIYPLCMIAKSCSLYIMVLITLERWIAVCKPFEVKIWCEYTTSQKIVAGIFAFAVLLNFPRFFEFKIVTNEDDELILRRYLLDAENHWWYFIIYFISISIVFDYMLPFVIMFISNSRIISEIRRTKSNRRLMSTQQHKEKKTTMMLLVITIFFGFCHFFSMALKLAESVAGGFLTIQNIYLEMLGEFFNFLIILHTSSTFFIYFVFSEKFRSDIQRLWREDNRKIRREDTNSRFLKTKT